SHQKENYWKNGDRFVRQVGQIPIYWAASEAGHHWEGEKGTKILKEVSVTTFTFSATAGFKA
ncbi:10189_t:CDS:2, partial [Entrophospora sp. SA101]